MIRNDEYIIDVTWKNYHFFIRKIYQKELFQQLIKPYRTTFILKLWKQIETIFVSHIWLNTQSMSATFDEFQVMLYQHLFDIIKLSETWLWNDTSLLHYVQIPGYSFCYKNRDERRVGGVGMHTKDIIKFKERQDLSKLDGTIEHMWIECQGKSKSKNYLVDTFYQPLPEEKEKLIRT